MMLNCLVGNLRDLMANRMSCSSKKYIKGRSLSLRIKPEYVTAGVIVQNIPAW